MTLSTPVSNQIQKPNVALALLGELNFTTGTQRLTTWGGRQQLMGYEWIGIPWRYNVSSIRESENIEYPAVDISLGIADPEILGLALGDEASYRGKLIRIWMVVMDEVYRVIDEPQLQYVGLMDQVSISTGDGSGSQGSLSLRCEQPGKDSRNPQTIRLTDAQHQLRYPGDTGLSRIPALAATKDQTWLSKKFQEV